MPCSTTARARSGHCHRDSGRPEVAGSSHASALIATTTSGGEGRGPSAPLQIIQPGQTLLVEPFGPLGHYLPWGVDSRREPIWSLRSPSAAINTTLARTTSVTVVP
jgi:hypothetical protein